MPLSNPVLDYWIDAAQRTALYWDIMRQRGNQYVEHNTQEVPHVLDFDFEPVMSGADLPRPVNYELVRIIPPEGDVIDPTLPPYVVIDPRAGHGPGIGGFKASSEIGIASRNGHACYFIGFRPEPLPDQTIEDVMIAEVAFLEKVIELHPEARSKPVVIGNCQAGWAVMMLASYRPDLPGAVIVAGAPLTYWAGVHGKNPMRYSGGWLGGTWMTRLTSDLGAGIFDGAWLVANFEGMNPANTLWSKQYNVYSKADTEGPRYLGFEKWWGGHVVLNGDEMQFITDNLFVGNTMPTGGVTTTDGVTIDYRNVQVPVVCFCSKEDNITPPQQALGWILDIYRDMDDLRAHGQTIIYAIHETTGHLGIFVSGKVTGKQHSEFISNMDAISVLPPGLYEAVMETKTAEDEDADLDPTAYITAFEPRTLDDIRALGVNDLEDKRRFETVQRMSEMTNAAYQTYAQPVVQAMATPEMAELARLYHPTRMSYWMWSDYNPMMAPVKAAAEFARKTRRPVEEDNPLWQVQEALSKQIVASLDAYRDLRDAGVEAGFMWAFGNPVLQAALGVPEGDPRPRPGESPEDLERIAAYQAELKGRMGEGGIREATVRALLYVAMSRDGMDERRFRLLNALRSAETDVSLDEFKSLVREQFLMLLMDEDAALAAISDMLDRDADKAGAGLKVLRDVSETAGMPDGETERRLELMVARFEAAEAAAKPKPKPRRKPRKKA